MSKIKLDWLLKDGILRDLLSKEIIKRHGEESKAASDNHAVVAATCNPWDTGYGYWELRPEVWGVFSSYHDAILECAMEGVSVAQQVGREADNIEDYIDDIEKVFQFRGFTIGKISLSYEIAWALGYYKSDTEIREEV